MNNTRILRIAALVCLIIAFITSFTGDLVMPPIPWTIAGLALWLSSEL